MNFFTGRKRSTPDGLHDSDGRKDGRTKQPPPIASSSDVSRMRKSKNASPTATTYFLENEDGWSKRRTQKLTKCFIIHATRTRCWSRSNFILLDGVQKDLRGFLAIESSRSSVPIVRTTISINGSLRIERLS